MDEATRADKYGRARGAAPVAGPARADAAVHAAQHLTVYTLHCSAPQQRIRTQQCSGPTVYTDMMTLKLSIAAAIVATVVRVCIVVVQECFAWCLRTSTAWQRGR